MCEKKAVQARARAIEEHPQPVVVTAKRELAEVDGLFPRTVDGRRFMPVQAVVIAEQEPDLAARANHGV